MTGAKKIECSVQGMLHGGRAMCGNVIVGCQFCGAKLGECNLQVVASEAHETITVENYATDYKRIAATNCKG